MRVTIEIDCANYSFGSTPYNAADEVLRILTVNAREKIRRGLIVVHQYGAGEEGDSMYVGRLFDSNGNHVGDVTVNQ